MILCCEKVKHEQYYVKIEGGKGSSRLNHVEQAKLAIADITLLYFINSTQAFDELTDPITSSVSLICLLESFMRCIFRKF